MSTKVLVFAESKDGKLRNVSLESLTVARQLAQGGEVFVSLFGPKASRFTQEVSQYGSGKVYVLEDEALSVYTTDAYTQALCQLIDEVQADVILMGHTAIGKDLAPRVAARLGIGLISDCTGVKLENGSIVFTRPIYSGKAFQKKGFQRGRVFATLRPNNFEVKKEPVRTEAVPFQPEIKDLRTIVKEIVRKTTSGVDLSEARVIVAGGRGVKSKEGFKPLQELAEVLGGAVGASRGACDAEYCDYSLQIGQTEKS